MTRLKDIYPLYLANEPVFSNADLVVTDKYSGEPATRVALADARTIDAGIAAAVNDSKFGLQAGVFTRDLYKMMRAWDRLDVGGVVIGDVPSYRIDNMPYGGVKDSGLGREGVRFAMEDMTEIRNLVIRRA